MNRLVNGLSEESFRQKMSPKRALFGTSDGLIVDQTALFWGSAGLALGTV